MTFHKRELNLILFLLPMIAGVFLLSTHYLYYGTLDFWDTFPSHESAGIIFILISLIFLFRNMFNYKKDDWLIKKNNNKFISKLLNFIKKR
jgi:hypothetical protein